MDSDASAKSGPSPHKMWMQRLKVPRDQIPDKIGDMIIDEQLLKDYTGHEYLLKARAKHPPHCREIWDEMRMCIIRKYDRETCERVANVYAPCSKELERARAARLLLADDERRKALAAKVKQLEQRAEGQQR